MCPNKSKIVNSLLVVSITFMTTPYSSAATSASQSALGVSTSTSGVTLGGEVNMGGTLQNQIIVTDTPPPNTNVGGQNGGSGIIPSEDITSSVNTAINNAVQGFVQPDPTQILGPRVKIGSVISDPNGINIGVITYDQNDIMQIAYDDQSLDLFTQNTPLNQLMNYLGYGVGGQRTAPLTISDANALIDAYNAQNPVQPISLRWQAVDGIASSYDYASAFLNGNLVTDTSSSAIFHDYMGVHAYQMASFPSDIVRDYAQQPLSFLKAAADDPTIMADSTLSTIVNKSLDQFASDFDTSFTTQMQSAIDPTALIDPNTGEYVYVDDATSSAARVVPTLNAFNDLTGVSPEANAALQDLATQYGGSLEDLQSYAKDPNLKSDLQDYFETQLEVMDTIQNGGSPFQSALTESAPSLFDDLPSVGTVAGTGLLALAAYDVASNLYSGNTLSAANTTGNILASTGLGLLGDALGIGAAGPGAIPTLLLLPTPTASNDTVFANVPNDPASIAAANANFNSGVQTATNVINSFSPLTHAAAAMSIDGSGNAPPLTSYLTPQFAAPASANPTNFASAMGLPGPQTSNTSTVPTAAQASLPAVTVTAPSGNLNSSGSAPTDSVDDIANMIGATNQNLAPTVAGNLGQTVTNLSLTITTTNNTFGTTDVTSTSVPIPEPTVNLPTDTNDDAASEAADYAAADWEGGYGTGF